MDTEKVLNYRYLCYY